jgi:hypothetical protein
MRIAIKDGRMRFIYSDEHKDLADIGKMNLKRVSHVEPDENNQWVADLAPVGGPKLGPFTLRKDALQAEVDWLNEHGVPCAEEGI